MNGVEGDPGRGGGVAGGVNVGENSRCKGLHGRRPSLCRSAACCASSGGVAERKRTQETHDMPEGTLVRGQRPRCNHFAPNGMLRVVAGCSMGRWHPLRVHVSCGSPCGRRRAWSHGIPPQETRASTSQQSTPPCRPCINATAKVILASSLARLSTLRRADGIPMFRRKPGGGGVVTRERPTAGAYAHKQAHRTRLSNTFK